MWIFLSDAFLSIVESPTDLYGEQLLVRARFSRDIKRVFPKARVQRTPCSDYRYRATVPRKTVELAITEQVRRIDYPNFKDSVHSPDRAQAYSDVWQRMWLAQQLEASRRPPRASRKRKDGAVETETHFTPPGTSGG